MQGINCCRFFFGLLFFLLLWLLFCFCFLKAQHTSNKRLRGRVMRPQGSGSSGRTRNNKRSILDVVVVLLLLFFLLLLLFFLFYFI